MSPESRRLRTGISSTLGFNLIWVLCWLPLGDELGDHAVVRASPLVAIGLPLAVAGAAMLVHEDDLAVGIGVGWAISVVIVVALVGAMVGFFPTY